LEGNDGAGDTIGCCAHLQPIACDREREEYASCLPLADALLLKAGPCKSAWKKQKQLSIVFESRKV
jgi:hypothetical protein